RRQGLAHARPRGPEGGRPVPAHRRGRLRGDRGDDPAAPRGGSLTSGIRSPSARFSILAFVAIVVPATLVAGLGYVSLRQWEPAADHLSRGQTRALPPIASGHGAVL